jgi:hypothetical protein
MCIAERIITVPGEYDNSCLVRVKGGTMSIEANKAIVRQLYDEFWNAEKLEIADELLHPDYVFAEGYGNSLFASDKSGRAYWHLS